MSIQSRTLTVEAANPKGLVHLALIAVLFLTYAALCGFRAYGVWSAITAQAKSGGWSVNFFDLLSFEKPAQACLAQPTCKQWIESTFARMYHGPLGFAGESTAWAWTALALGVVFAIVFIGMLTRSGVGWERMLPGPLMAILSWGGVVGVGGLMGMPLLPLMILAYPIAFALGWGLTRMALPELVSYASGRFASDAEVKALRITSRNLRQAIPLARLDKDGKQLIGSFPTRKKRELDHLLVVAPTRGGKGLHISRTLWDWGGSVVVVDLKGEAYRRTAVRRQELGSRVFLLDPEGIGNRYDPFAEMARDESIAAAAEVVTKPKEDKEPIFAQRAAYLFQALVYAARAEGVPSGEFFYRVMGEGENEVYRYLEEAGRRPGEDWNQARRYFNLYFGSKSDDKFRASCYSLLLARMRPFMTEGVRRMMGGMDFTAKSLIEQSTTLYIRLSEENLDFTQGVVQILLMTLTNTLTRTVDREMGGYAQVPVLFVFDEAKRIPIPSIANGVSTWAGRNLYAAIYVQDLSQLEGTYGEGDAKTVLGNTVQIFYLGNPNLETAKYVSEKLGNAEVVGAGFNASKSKQDGSEGMNYSLKERALITPDEFSSGSNDEVVVFPRSTRPIRARRVTPHPDMKNRAAYPDAPEPAPLDPPAPFALPKPVVAPPSANPPQSGVIPPRPQAAGPNRGTVYTWPRGAVCFWDLPTPRYRLLNGQLEPDPLEPAPLPPTAPLTLVCLQPEEPEARALLDSLKVAVTEVIRPRAGGHRAPLLVMCGRVADPKEAAVKAERDLGLLTVQGGEITPAFWRRLIRTPVNRPLLLLPPYPSTQVLQEISLVLGRTLIPVCFRAPSGSEFYPDLAARQTPLPPRLPPTLQSYRIDPALWVEWVEEGSRAAVEG